MVRITRSIQIRQMIAMVFVASISIYLIDWTYRIWLVKMEQEALAGRITRALDAYPDALLPIEKKEVYPPLILLMRRFDLSSAAITFSGKVEVSAHVGTPVNQKMVKKLIKKLGKTGSNALLKTDGDSQTELWGIHKLAGKPDKRYLIISASSSNEDITLEKISPLSYVALIGSTLIAILLSYLMRGMLIKPVKNLSKAMNKVAKGDFSQQINPEVDYELIGLVTNFNHMLDKLRQSREKVTMYQNSLEHRIEEARGEIAEKEEELIQSAKLASLGQLAAGVAHEINNPLYHIMLTAGLVREDVTDKATRKRIDDMITQTKRCRNIVSDLLEYSRKGATEPETFDIRDQITESVNQIRQQGALENIEIEINLPDTPLQICGIKDELRRVIDTVIMNAAQAIEESGTLCITADTGDNSIINIKIEDSGAGMDEETQKRIFEPFFTTKPVGQGTGLGLAIAYSAVKRHDGRITIKSAPGEGTCVTIILPPKHGHIRYENPPSTATQDES